MRYNIESLIDSLGDQKDVLIFLDESPIGHKIKVKRTADNFTQLELAKILGMSPGTLGEIENGIRQPSLRMLDAIDDYLYHCWYDDKQLIDRIEY